MPLRIMASRRNHLLFLLVLLSLEAITGDEHTHKVRQYCLRLSLDLFLYVPPQLIASSLLCSFKLSLSYFVKFKIIVDGKFSFCWCDRSYLLCGNMRSLMNELWEIDTSAYEIVSRYTLHSLLLRWKQVTLAPQCKGKTLLQCLTSILRNLTCRVH